MLQDPVKDSLSIRRKKGSQGIRLTQATKVIELRNRVPWSRHDCRRAAEGS